MVAIVLGIITFLAIRGIFWYIFGFWTLSDLKITTKK